MDSPALFLLWEDKDGEPCGYQGSLPAPKSLRAVWEAGEQHGPNHTAIWGMVIISHCPPSPPRVPNPWGHGQRVPAGHPARLPALHCPMSLRAAPRRGGCVLGRTEANHRSCSFSIQREPMAPMDPNPILNPTASPQLWVGGSQHCLAGTEPALPRDAGLGEQVLLHTSSHGQSIPTAPSSPPQGRASVSPNPTFDRAQAQLGAMSPMSPSKDPTEPAHPESRRFLLPPHFPSKPGPAHHGPALLLSI